jgi:hypothetical protein
MNVIDDAPGVVIASPEDIQLMEEKEHQLQQEVEEELVDDELLQSSLAAHIQNQFQINKDARITSGIERKMLQSLRAYNGHYDPEDLARIQESGGSEIFMNITPTKCRAAMSWIRSILLPAKENAWSLSPTPIPEIPKETKDKIRRKVESFVTSEEQGNSPVDAASKLQEQNQIQADIEDAISDEIYKVARKSVARFEKQIEDELAEGGWEDALSDFIEDFCVFQVAIMKAPVITRRKTYTWKDGQPVVTTDFIYLNKRVSPLDIYPSPNSTHINEGNLCEHIRLSRKELYNLIGTTGYQEEEIREILRDGSTPSWLNESIEEDKVIEEYRGDSSNANKGVYHGIHYHGTASYEQLVDFGIPQESLGDDTDKEFDIEAILVGNRVIKAVLMDDPLLRRPYYKASFQNIPGSWWGRSLPELMRDIQRMCNATARALSNNMSISSGPQIDINIDRLAADEEIEGMRPWKVWQTTSDPTGAGGRAITFWQPSSNANELLAVYREFELRSDDATGIPRYAYGNSHVGGAAATASGLSMLLESASKGIKDAIRHIDDGLIRPRIEYQFYYDMITNPDSDFTGDVKVVAKGSQALTMKAAQEMRRNEFLQIISNPTIFQIVGVEGLAEILREMSRSLGLGEDIIPSRVELRMKQKKLEQLQAQQQQQEVQSKESRAAVGVQQVQIQTAQAEQASQRAAALKEKELQLKAAEKEKDRQIKLMELEARREESTTKSTTALAKQQSENAQKDRSENKRIAMELSTNGTENFQP